MPLKAVSTTIAMNYPGTNDQVSLADVEKTAVHATMTSSIKICAVNL